VGGPELEPLSYDGGPTYDLDEIGSAVSSTSEFVIDLLTENWGGAIISGLDAVTDIAQAAGADGPVWDTLDMITDVVNFVDDGSLENFRVTEPLPTDQMWAPEPPTSLPILDNGPVFIDDGSVEVSPVNFVDAPGEELVEVFDRNAYLGGYTSLVSGITYPKGTIRKVLVPRSLLPDTYGAMFDQSFPKGTLLCVFQDDPVFTQDTTLPAGYWTRIESPTDVSRLNPYFAVAL
jgi:hypothetical protein